MMAKGRPRIGVISDSALQRHHLNHALSGYGLETPISGDLLRLKEVIIHSPSPVDCWILELENEDEWPDFLETLLDTTDTPILFGLGNAPEKTSEEYPRWERRLFAKLREELGTVEILDTEETLSSLEGLVPKRPASINFPAHLQTLNHDETVEQVWILAASLGGPAAVKEFLDQLPPGLPIAFIYAQHIDAHFIDALVNVLARHSFLALKKALHGSFLHAGEVVMAPVDKEMVLDEEGRIFFKDSPWPGPYGPSIDQTMLNVAQYYGKQCHTILFSGMGNDGAIAAPILKKQGCQIWVQQSDSCANSSMPDSVLETGAATYSGTPRQLAEQLVKLFIQPDSSLHKIQQKA